MYSLKHDVDDDTKHML